MKLIVQMIELLLLLACLGLSQAQLNERSKTPRSLFWSGNDDSDGGDGSVGIGLGTMWGQAVEGIARQPEAADEITAAAILGSLFMVTSPAEMTELFFSSNGAQRSQLAETIKTFADELTGRNTILER